MHLYASNMISTKARMIHKHFIELFFINSYLEKPQLFLEILIVKLNSK